MKSMITLGLDIEWGQKLKGARWSRDLGLDEQLMRSIQFRSEMICAVFYMYA